MSKVDRFIDARRSDALKIDLKHPEPFYGDFDKDMSCYYVFGINSGFAYRECRTLEDAEAEAARMTKVYKGKVGIS